MRILSLSEASIQQRFLALQKFACPGTPESNASSANCAGSGSLDAIGIHEKRLLQAQERVAQSLLFESRIVHDRLERDGPRGQPFQLVGLRRAAGRHGMLFKGADGALDLKRCVGTLSSASNLRECCSYFALHDAKRGGFAAPRLRGTNLALPQLLPR